VGSRKTTDHSGPKSSSGQRTGEVDLRDKEKTVGKISKDLSQRQKKKQWVRCQEYLRDKEKTVGKISRDIFLTETKKSG
jgi:hypothetical protein